MLNPIDSFKNFLYTQYFSDGIKITIGALLPSLIFFQLGKVEIGLALSLGAICASFSDSPGPWIHRRNAMLITIALVIVTAFFMSLVNQVYLYSVLTILIFTFIFSMFTVYGARASAVGNAGIFIMILNIDLHAISVLTNLEHIALLLGGGIWYFLLSLAFSTLRPYRYSQQTLGECIQEISEYLRIRAKFYNHNIKTEDVFKELVEKQIQVHELQDNVREALFKTRKLVNETTFTGRRLTVIFADMVDLFEQSMATHHDYNVIRERYKNYDILPEYALLIHKCASDIEYIGFCILHQIKPTKHHLTLNDLDQLKEKLDNLEKQGISVIVLKKIFINLRAIYNRTNLVFGYFDTDNFKTDHKSVISNNQKFVEHQTFEFKVFKNNLNLSSSTFRYALRLSLVITIGFLISQFLPIGHHSYWILITIMVILKPGFSTTKERNQKRVIGTILGGLLGAAILYYIHNQNILFALMLLFMIITYSTQRIYYFICVLFMTPFILIYFSFISTASGETIALERIIDTLIGSSIAIVSSYLLFPSWEQFKIKSYMSDILQANLNYLNAIYKKLAQKEDYNITEYKLARKEVYVKTANLSAAFQRMMNEPKHKQYKVSELLKFVVLNHVLSSYLANLSETVNDADFDAEGDFKKQFNKSTFYLNETIDIITQQDSDNNTEHTRNLSSINLEANKDDLINEQMELIVKVSSDLNRVIRKLYDQN